MVYYIIFIIKITQKMTFSIEPLGHMLHHHPTAREYAVAVWMENYARWLNIPTILLDQFYTPVRGLKASYFAILINLLDVSLICVRLLVLFEVDRSRLFIARKNMHIIR